MWFSGSASQNVDGVGRTNRRVSYAVLFIVLLTA